MANQPKVLPKVRGQIEWGNDYVGVSVKLEDGSRRLVPACLVEKVALPKAKS